MHLLLRGAKGWMCSLVPGRQRNASLLLEVSRVIFGAVRWFHASSAVQWHISVVVSVFQAISACSGFCLLS